MFFYKHKVPTTANDPEVILLCKCFCKDSVNMLTIFTKRFKNDSEFTKFVSRDDTNIVSLNELREVEETLHKTNVLDALFKKVVNRSLYVSQTNIFSVLNKSYIKCNSDAVKWYIFTSIRLVVGEEDENPFTFANLIPVLSKYYSLPKGDLKPFSIDENGSLLDKKNVIGDVYSTYTNWFGGAKMLNYLLLTTEVLCMSKMIMKKLMKIYDQYRTCREVSSANISFANSKYYDMLRGRFETVLDVLDSIDEDPEISQKHMEDYNRALDAINNNGSEYIRAFLSNSVKYEQYDPEKHSSYKFDENYTLMNGITPLDSCGNVCKELLKEDLFPHSISKCIRGNTINMIAKLCNSNMSHLVCDEKIKDTVRHRHNIPTDTAFVAAPFKRHGYLCGKIINKSLLDEGYTNISSLKKIKLHNKNPSIPTYNDYSRSLREKSTKLCLNEIIVPRMPLYTLSIDVDDKELGDKFYMTEPKKSWLARIKVIELCEKIMMKYLKWVRAYEEDFTCQLYESRPDSLEECSRVGLRVIYQFKRLAFKDSDVVKFFLKGFKYMMKRYCSSLGYGIDEAIYGTPNGHHLRLPMQGKQYIEGVNPKLSRQLVPLFTRPNASFKPSFGLVHALHNKLEKENLLVMSKIGDITSLEKKYSPRNAEFDILINKRKKRKTAVDSKTKLWLSKDSDDNDVSLSSSPSNQSPTSPHSQIDEFTQTRQKFVFDYLHSIMNDEILNQIMSQGGGYLNCEFTGLKRSLGKSSQGDEYCLIPNILWCTRRKHMVVERNPCRYYVKIYPEEKLYRVSTICFGCGPHKNVCEGHLPDGLSID